MHDEQSTPAVEIEMEDTVTKTSVGHTSITGFLLRNRKRFMLGYLVLGIILFILMIQQPELQSPYIIEIFNR